MLDNALVFARVVECGNFSKAARDLGITPASVSKKIIRIEEALGTSLLYRNTRGVQLTSQGEVYYRLMRRALDATIEAEQAVRELATTMSGVIRIASGPSFTNHVLAPALARLVNAYPDILVEINVTTNPLSAAQEGADIMFQWGEIKNSDLIAKHIMTDRLVTVCSPKFFKDHGLKSASREDIFKHTVSVTNNYVPPLTYVSSPDRDEFVFRQIVTDDIETVLAIVVAGAGVTLLPRFAVREQVELGTLVEIQSPDDVQAIHGYAVFHTRPSNNLRISTFMKFVSERIEQLNG